MFSLKSAAAGLYLGIAAIGLTAVSSNNAHAVLTAEDLPEIVGLDTFLTRDPATNLDWLDVNLTRSLSFDDITGGAPVTDAGSALFGLNPINGAEFAANPFRHATVAELLTLFVSAAIPNPESGLIAANFASVTSLIALLGRTDDNASGTLRISSKGFLSDEPFTNIRNIGFLLACRSESPTNCSVPSGTGQFFFGLTDTTLVSPSGDTDTADAHFLVRTSPSAAAVSEPASVVLMIGGLAAMAGMRRRRRNG